ARCWRPRWSWSGSPMPPTCRRPRSWSGAPGTAPRRVPPSRPPEPGARRLPDHHRQLGGRQRGHLDRAGGRRLRQDLPDRQPADQRPAPGLLQRGAPAVRPRVGHALAAPVPVPEVSAPPSTMAAPPMSVQAKRRSEPVEFLIARGGPYYDLQRRLGLLREEALHAGRRAVILVGLAWAVPLVLSAIAGHATGPAATRPFLLDLGAWARFFVAIGIFVLMERLV